MDGNFTQMSNSELFRTEFVEKVLPPEDSEDKNPLKLDDYVLEKVQLALKTCRHKIDLAFYASAADYLDPQAKKPAKETEETSNIEVDGEQQAEAGEAEESQEQEQ